MFNNGERFLKGDVCLISIVGSHLAPSQFVDKNLPEGRLYMLVVDYHIATNQPQIDPSQLNGKPAKQKTSLRNNINQIVKACVWNGGQEKTAWKLPQVYDPASVGLQLRK